MSKDLKFTCEKCVCDAPWWRGGKVYCDAHYIEQLHDDLNHYIDREIKLTTAVKEMLECEDCGGMGKYYINLCAKSGYIVAKADDKRAANYPNWTFVTCSCRKKVEEMVT